MNDIGEVDIVEEIITLYAVLYILGYIKVCDKLVEDLKLDSETPDIALERYTIPTWMRVYTWPELD